MTVLNSEYSNKQLLFLLTSATLKFKTKTQQ